MSKITKYFIPVEIIEKEHSELLGIRSFRYKLFSDDDVNAKFTRIDFWDLNGIIIGTHMPTKLKTTYDKAIEQAKLNAAKVATDIKNVATSLGGTTKDVVVGASNIVGSVKDEVKDVVVGVAGEMKGDVSKTIKFAHGLWGKIKDFANTNDSKECCDHHNNESTDTSKDTNSSQLD